jgi:hypothetical protein
MMRRWPASCATSGGITFRHVSDLNELIEDGGGEAVNAEAVADAGLLVQLAETAALQGATGLLVALLGNETLTNGAYLTAVDLPCPEEVRAVLERNRQDEQRHLRWLLEARSRLGVTFPVQPTAA